MSMKKIVLLSMLFGTVSTTNIEANQGEPMELQTNNQNAPIVNNRVIEIGKTYKHYSGKLYKVLAIARYSEDPAMMYVIYEALYDCPTFGKNSTWARPYTMFAENVVINGQEVARFADI